MQTLHPFLKSKDGFQKPLVVALLGFSVISHKKHRHRYLKRFLAHREFYFYIFFASAGFF
jgi:hypothetical protein